MAYLKPTPRRRPIKPILIVVLILLLVAAYFLVARPGPAPEVSLEADRPGVGREPTNLVVHVKEPTRGVSKVRVEAVQGDGEPVVLAEETLTPRPTYALWQERTAEHTIEVPVSRETVENLEEGDLKIRVVASRAPGLLGEGDPTTQELDLPVRLRPPTLSVQTTQHYLSQGGSGVVRYTVGETALEEGGRDGVQAGEWFFEGFPYPGGQPTDRFALFGVPYTLDDRNQIRLVATDPFGNESEARFTDQFQPKPIRNDTITLSDPFMEKVTSEIMGQTPSLSDKGDLVANYVQINSELRKTNAEELIELGEKSATEFLWQGVFKQMPNSQVMASFADRRSYMYEGEKVDQQDHLGFDLATRRGDSVPASNAGKVVLARYFGIYGNTVVIDHGYGLQTLYSHLSSIDVAEGDTVAQGDSIGRTGETGLAGGDHLHFTVMVDGLPVSPGEWWDPKWVREKVCDKLGDVAACPGAAAAGSEAATATPAG